jgi:hypothetical protein
LLNLVKQYIGATTEHRSITTPFGHNKTLNEFAKNHKEVKGWKPLAEMDLDTANMLAAELDRYVWQIG